MGKFDLRYNPKFALYTMGDKSGIVCGFTNDTAQVSSAINAIQKYNSMENYFNKSLADATDYYQAQPVYSSGLT